MRVSSNLNSMMQLETQLDKSAKEVSRLNANIADKNQENKDSTPSSEETPINEVDLTKEMVSQIVIPIAYTANAEVITTQDSVDKTLLDIKA